MLIRLKIDGAEAIRIGTAVGGPFHLEALEAIPVIKEGTNLYEHVILI